MCATLTNDQALDQRPTNRAGLTFPIIHAEVILELSTAIDPVDAGPATADTLLQDFPDRLPQGLCLLPTNGIGRCKRVQTCPVQSFVGIDIAQPGQKGLVEQQRLQLPVPGS